MKGKAGVRNKVVYTAASALLAGALVAVMVRLWSSQVHAARTAVVLLGLGSLAAPAAWAHLAQVRRSGRTVRGYAVVSAFFTCLLTTSWLVGIPASLFMAPFVLVMGAPLCGLTWLAHSLVLKGRWAGIVLQMALGAAGAAVALWRPIEDDFWIPVLWIFTGFLAALPASRLLAARAAGHDRPDATAGRGPQGATRRLTEMITRPPAGDDHEAPGRRAETEKGDPS